MTVYEAVCARCHMICWMGSWEVSTNSQSYCSFSVDGFFGSVWNGALLPVRDLFQIRVLCLPCVDGMCDEHELAMLMINSMAGGAMIRSSIRNVSILYERWKRFQRLLQAFHLLLVKHRRKRDLGIVKMIQAFDRGLRSYLSSRRSILGKFFALAVTELVNFGASCEVLKR